MKRYELDRSLESIEGSPGGGWVSYVEAKATLDEALDLLRADAKLWHEWRTVDITDDDERWVDFTNRAHANHDATLAYLKKMGVKP
jgi:hypothetical protein